MVGLPDPVAQHRVQQRRVRNELRRLLGQPDVPEDMDGQANRPCVVPLLLLEHRHRGPGARLRPRSVALRGSLRVEAGRSHLHECLSARLLPEPRVATTVLTRAGRKDPRPSDRGWPLAEWAVSGCPIRRGRGELSSRCSGPACSAWVATNPATPPSMLARFRRHSRTPGPGG
jgi:hypothetical protein